MNIPGYLFWNIVRINPTLNRVWMWTKTNTPLPTFLNILNPYPTGIEIEVTTRCGLRCIMCEHTYWNEPKRDMSYEQFVGIIEQFPNLRWIGLTGIGEGSLHKDFNRMLGYLKERGILIDFFNTLNFVSKKDLKYWMSLPVNRLDVSIDAATEDTYEKVRVGGTYQRVIDNIAYLFECKGTTTVGFHYIIGKYNIGEVLQFIDLINALRQGKKTHIRYTRILHKFREVESSYIEIPKELQKKVEKKGQEVGIEISWNADVPATKPPVKRCLEFFEPFIFVTGHVIPCCAGNEANGREYQKETALGNILETPFPKIWAGKEYSELRKQIRKGRVPIPCSGCPLYR